MKVSISALVLAVGVAGVSQAATISWGAAQNTTGASDVVAGGAVVEARNGLSNVAYLADTPAMDTTVSGVLFDATNFLGQTFAGEPDGAALAGNTTGDTAYDTLIGNLTVVDGATLGNGSTNIIGNYVISGLTSGTDYLVQAWYTDLKGSSAGRSMFLDGTTSLDGDAGSFGQYAIGSFTADASTQTVTFSTSSAGRAQISGVLVREVVPEPGSLALLSLGGLMIARRRRA